MTMTNALAFRSDVLIKKARAAGDTTLYAIAVRTGVRESTISRILAGLTIPTLATLASIATAYGTTLDELVERGSCLLAAVPTQRGEAAA
ncbi:hypothetical protein GCM10010387_16470 [Streptomyces inusitatus]|uniref:HTH cro/C1-type domain-containing protein n=1 Tax=Streptomyces inusitatus TaxID=68221 RepID=A0A918PUR8_9ACTN|nr:helix-turn-helix transcriptional regulator [Streptomyces inusitatus]GGZ23915.1 hypothetical protein GCM10010387_16470 [Streptomyces inusitatus]